MRVDVSIIIVNYRTKNLVEDCIKSIRRHTSGINYEIIVVDNASEDLSQLQESDVRIIQSDTNLGFGRANNLGANEAKGEVLFFLNPDTILLNNAVKILYDALFALPKCGVCGANIYDAELNPHHSYFYCTMTLKHALRSVTVSNEKLYHIKNQHNFENRPKRVEYVTGADLMIRKELFEEIGQFNPEIFMYYEDVELCSKVRKRHLKCYSVPEAKIQHLEGQSFKPGQTSSAEISDRKRRMSGDSVVVFLKSSYSRFHYKSILNAHALILKLKLMIKQTEGAKQQLSYFKYIKSKL